MYLRANADAVVYICDARRRPCDMFGFFALNPRSNRALECYASATRLDGNVARVDHCVTLEGFLDLALHLGRCDSRRDTEGIVNSLNSFQPADSSCRPFLLEIPFNLAFERNPPVSDNRFYVLCAAGQLTLDRCDGIARDIGVRPLPTTNTCNDDVDRLFGRY